MDTEDRRKMTELGYCRWCSKKGIHKYLDKEYTVYGFKEVYADIVYDCFNMSVSLHSSTSMLVCLSCIERLREAQSFRDMVAKVELRIDPLQKLDSEDDEIFIIKAEDIKDDCISEAEYLEDDIPNETDEYNIPDDMVPGERDLLNKYPPIRNLPVKLPKAFARCVKSLRGRIITAKDIDKLLTPPATKEECTRKYVSHEKSTLMYNVSIIFEYSNAIPFKSSNIKGFPCFYCRQYSESFEQVREHICTEHQNEKISNVLQKYGPENLLVYADVSGLMCTRCNQKQNDLNELKKHLINVHKLKINLKVNRIVPFDLSNGFTCSNCPAVYQTFGSLERHMNVHFRNYFCRECGAGFMTKARLKTHSKSIHITGNFPCTVCNKVFPTQHRMKVHLESVHNMIKRFKCKICGLRFNEYFARQKHLVNAHGAKPLQYTCKVCDRTFDRQYSLSKHMKKIHLEEKNHQCEFCPYTSFTSSELKMHLIKHNGERVHECRVCKKSYARKKTLVEHMRIHNNDRRHVCPLCRQGFVQKCSLKGHLKTHHPDYNFLKDE